jgi:hypothetical protein
MVSPTRPTDRSSSRSSVMGPKGISSDRRNRQRLRELCDEVLASFRVASGKDLFNEGDRADARSMLSRVVAGSARR